MCNFGRKMRSARVLKGISQTDLALKMNLTQSTISHIEVGMKNPSAKFIKKLAAALNIPVKKLVEISEEKNEMNILINNLKKLPPQMLTKINEMVEWFVK